jgi:hypothetical protein
MRPWKEIITEAKDKKNMTAAEIRKAGEAALKDEQTKNKKEKNNKKKSEYTEYLKQQLEFKKKKYEEQKRKELENLKKKGTEKHKEGIKSSLSGVKTQTISSKDTDPTAYTKAVGNVASLAGGLAKAAVHGVGYLAAKKKAKAAKSAQPEKKEPKSPGRPAREKSSPSGVTTPASYGGAKQISGAPEPKLLSPQRKRLVPATKRLPPSGGVPEGSAGPKAKTLGQRARQNPKIRAGLIQQRMGEEYSNWKEEFIIEVDDKNGKTEKKKIIDVMRGKNKIEINPNIKEERDEEGGMAQNELSTIEKSVKSLRKKIKSETQQLPAWVQSKISKAADYIDTVADYMDGNPEPVKEAHEDETFRQHSRETFSSHQPSETRKRTASVLKMMKQMNADVEKPKKKKKKKAVVEECGCEDDGKKVLMMAILKKAADAKKKKNFQLNSGIIGEEKTAAWQRKEGKNPEGGLNKKGIASYRRENPGSKLSMAVTTPPSELDPDSKAAKRRKSFCARMGGMPGPMKDEKGRPTRKALSLRKWNC